MMERSSFLQSIEQLEGLLALPALPAKDVGLRRAARLLDEIGNPHRAFRAVLITGSSGKGSTTSMVGSILEAAGYRTGIFRSPHLWSYTERISLDGLDISDADWVEGFTRVWPVAEAMASGTLRDYDLGRPGFFEVLLALAALYFCRRQVEWAAVEVGMGGRLDATNLLDADVSVVTTVSLEHTHILGRTVQEIAREKAAIFKPKGHAVIAISDPEARKVAVEHAENVGAELLRVPEDVSFELTRQDPSGIGITVKTGGSSITLSLPLAGTFQAINAATAAAVALALKRRGATIGREDIKVGLQTVRVPGRFELLAGEPEVLLDGAHHPAAARAFRAAFDAVYPGRPFVLLFAAMADKDVQPMASALGTDAHCVVVTRVPGSPRSGLPEQQAPYFEQIAVPTEIEADPERALSRARSLVPEGGLLVVCGSLYLVGLARHLLMQSIER